MDLNVKKILKSVNRGVLLGAIIFLGLVIYLVIDSINFKKDIPKFEQFIEDYYAEMAEFAITPEENRKLNDLGITKKEIERVKKDYTNFINENWTNYSNEFYYNTTKEDLISGTEYYDSLSERVIKYFNGYVVDWKYRLTDIKVRKSGPNIVSVSFTDDVTIEAVGNPLLMAIDGPQPPQYMEYIKNYEEFKSNNEVQKYNRSISYTIRLMKIDGEWKIYGLVNDWYSSFELVGGDGNGNINFAD